MGGDLAALDTKLAKLAQMAPENAVPKLPKPPKLPGADHFGDFDHFSTGPAHDLDERIARRRSRAVFRPCTLLHSRSCN